jgi:hypothetical protein
VARVAGVELAGVELAGVDGDPGVLLAELAIASAASLAGVGRRRRVRLRKSAACVWFASRRELAGVVALAELRRARIATARGAKRSGRKKQFHCVEPFATNVCRRSSWFRLASDSLSESSALHSCLSAETSMRSE